MSLTPSRKASSGQRRYCSPPPLLTSVSGWCRHVCVFVNVCNVGLSLQGARWALVAEVGDTLTATHPVPTPTRAGSGQPMSAPRPGHIQVHPGKIWRWRWCDGLVDLSRGVYQLRLQQPSASLIHSHIQKHILVWWSTINQKITDSRRSWMSKSLTQCQQTTTLQASLMVSCRVIEWDFIRLLWLTQYIVN